ncbi:hypothetical protein B0H13DRAFT_1969685 [Mycena leptocephala]|nr:hypothetical protein B0H13DRAFT_1969685 [Mycena leptocephala]
MNSTPARRSPTVMEVDELDPLELRQAPPLPSNHPSVFIDYYDEQVQSDLQNSRLSPDEEDPMSYADTVTKSGGPERFPKKVDYEDRSASLTPLEPPSESAHHAECSSMDPTPVDTDPEIPFIGPDLEAQGMDFQLGTVQEPLFYSDDDSDHVSSETPTISRSPVDPLVLSHNHNTSRVSDPNSITVSSSDLESWYEFVGTTLQVPEHSAGLCVLSCNNPADFVRTFWFLTKDDTMLIAKAHDLATAPSFREDTARARLLDHSCSADCRLELKHRCLQPLSRRQRC